MVSRRNLTAVRDRLEAAGLVERVRGSRDSGLRHVRLAPEGERVWAETREGIRACCADALTGFSTEECVVPFRLSDGCTTALRGCPAPRETEVATGSWPATDPGARGPGSAVRRHACALQEGLQARVGGAMWECGGCLVRLSG
ncbi:hypothetical protein GCM10010964_38860 [Caldovatus sediminis]|uniref:MarR family transcriptional regulator n=1 Tax=Caldovatus sediminis TaxID=2041189 RepID=A0A8J2ZEQ0_9PROT|nr:hypothetical protein GCM10010964_38860 [Caldovatus sediminis]